MGQESTYVAAEIAAADSDMQTDLACKRVLAQKVILARILQRTVNEYQNYTPEEISERFIDKTEIMLFKEVSPGMTNHKETVDGESTESNVPGEGKVYFDLRVNAILPDEWRTKTQFFLHIDVEAQKEYRPGYPIEKRAIYYIARMLSSQIEKVSEGTSYAGLQKVYSIWICLGKDIPKNEQQTITRIHLTKEDLVGSVAMKEETYDLLELIIIRLGDREPEDKLLGMLTTLLWKQMSVEERMFELGNKYGIPMKQEVKEEVGSMCSYSAAIKERALEEGKEIGEEIGKEIGKAIGEVKGRAEAICVLLDSMGMVPDGLRAKILAAQDTEILNSWLKLAKKSDSLEEFLSKSGLQES